MNYEKQIRSITDTIDDNEEIFNTYVEGLLNYESEYSEVWGKVLSAQKEYQDALLNGDSESAVAAVEKMNEAQIAWANAGWSNEAVNMYMVDFFDKFTELSKNYQYEIELKASLADPDDTFGNFIKDTVEKFKNEDGKVDLYEVLNTGMEYEDNPNKNSRRHTLPEDQQAYVGLKFAADEYGISVEQLLQLLDKLGYIELKNAEIAQDSANTYFDSVAQIRKGYDTLQSATENAVDVQLAMKNIFADNTHLTEDAYNSLVTLAGGETALADCIDTTNGYLVTNADGLRGIVEASEEALMTDLKLAQSHEKLNYHELVNQLYDVTDGVENYDEATLSTINTILDQIDATKQQIAQYKLLEQQLLGVTNAFTELDNFLSSLEVETLEGKIYDCDQAMTELLKKQAELGESGKIGTDEWNELQTEIDETKSKMEELRSTARENISAHIEIDAQITEKQKEVDSLKSDLDSLDETDAEYEATMTNYVDAQDQLATLLQQKYDLELPTELTIQVALEQVQQEITDTQAELDKIAEFDGKTYTAVAGVDQTEVDALVDKLDSLESEQSQIMLYAGIDDEDVLSSLETIQNFVIEDKNFTMKMDGYGTTRNRLIEVQNLLKGIKSKTIYVTTVTRTQSTRAFGTALAQGNAHESGNWGTPTAEKDALVGELGEELVVDPKTGTYQTVGTNGAEFVDLPKGAIVFNHRQTEELLKNRRINSRGIAYVKGNAHFTFLDRTYSLGKDSVPNSTKNSNVKGKRRT